jgi:23S rRNA pseudouridine1911/1915/1917 synthase
MEQAIRKSKKKAGGKRRKTLAASRRKLKVSNVGEVEEELRCLCGDDFSVLHETDGLLVVNKPSGVPCFHRKTTTAGKIRKRKGKDAAVADDISLEDALISCNVPLSTLNPEALGLVHRLDRGSSGCLVLAKTDEMHALLVSEFFLRRTEKTYLTVVSPAPDLSTPQGGTIDQPVDGRPAKSRYRIKQRFSDSAALLEFDIYTGRKHQIRVHASEALASPVYLDPLYSNPNDHSHPTAGNPQQQFLLHASSLRIPKYGIEVEAPIPKWWSAITASFET